MTTPLAFAQDFVLKHTGSGSFENMKITPALVQPQVPLRVGVNHIQVVWSGSAAIDIYHLPEKDWNQRRTIAKIPAAAKDTQRRAFAQVASSDGNDSITLWANVGSAEAKYQAGVTITNLTSA